MLQLIKNGILSFVRKGIINWLRWHTARQSHHGILLASFRWHNTSQSQMAHIVRQSNHGILLVSFRWHNPSQSINMAYYQPFSDGIYCSHGIKSKSEILPSLERQKKKTGLSGGSNLRPAAAVDQTRKWR